jgi:acetylglutamate kinase
VSPAAVTIKLGGVAGGHAASLDVVARSAPPATVLVHGGGNEVAAWSRRLGIEPRSHEGLRVTDPETLEVVVAVLAGLVNTRLVAALRSAGRPAIGLTGVDGGLLRLRHRDASLGEVGEVVGVEPAVVDRLVAAGDLPVVASVGADDTGALLNVNADEAAGAIAAARGGLLLLCTDVAGVLRDGRLLERIGPDEAEAMLVDGTASAGMRPKLRAALVAARAGCVVRIIDGRAATGMACALEGDNVGTEVTAA